MADDTTSTNTEPMDGQAAQQAEHTGTDWKAEARKWEQRSKANAEAAAELERIKAERMSETEKAAAKAEKAEKRAAEAEQELERLRAESQRAKDAAEVSAATGVPASLITATDRKAMEEQAAAIKAYADGRTTAPVFKADGKKPDGPKRSKQDQFAEFFNQISHNG